MSTLITSLCIIGLCIFTYAYISMYNSNKCKTIKYNINPKDKISKIAKMIKIKNEYYKDGINIPRIFDSKVSNLLSNNNNLFFKK